MKVSATFSIELETMQLAKKLKQNQVDVNKEIELLIQKLATKNNVKL